PPPPRSGRPTRQRRALTTCAPPSIPPPMHVPASPPGVAKQPDQHPFGGHAAEVLACVRHLPATARDPVGTADGDQLAPAPAIVEADGRQVVAPPRRLHLDGTGLRKQLEREPGARRRVRLGNQYGGEVGPGCGSRPRTTGRPHRLRHSSPCTRIPFP